jgi:hypothetical protein
MVESSGAIRAVARRATEASTYHGDNSLIATVFSAFGFEAWVNELLHNVRHTAEPYRLSPLDRLHPMIAAARLQERSTSLRTRLDVIGTVVQGEGWTLGKAPFQDLGLLLDIRNELAHVRPEMTSVDIYEDDGGAFHFHQERLTPIGERLVQAKVVQRPKTSDITPLLRQLQDQNVGAWACRTVRASIAAVRALAPGSAWELACGVVTTSTN